jgi:hypothetical protein
MGMLKGFLGMELPLASMAMDPMACWGMLMEHRMAYHHGMQECWLACLHKDLHRGMLVDLLACRDTAKGPRMSCRRMTMGDQLVFLAMALGMTMASILAWKRQSLGREYKRSERKEWANKKTLDHKTA